MNGVISTWAPLIDGDLVARAEQMATQARDRTFAQLLQELGGDMKKATSMLDWFEKELVGLDRGVDA